MTAAAGATSRTACRAPGQASAYLVSRERERERRCYETNSQLSLHNPIYTLPFLFGRTMHRGVIFLHSELLVSGTIHSLGEVGLYGLVGVSLSPDLTRDGWSGTFGVFSGVQIWEYCISGICYANNLHERAQEPCTTITTISQSLKKIKLNQPYYFGWPLKPELPCSHSVPSCNAKLDPTPSKNMQSCP